MLLMSMTLKKQHEIPVTEKSVEEKEAHNIDREHNKGRQHASVTCTQ
jgi:hypothetical protein